MPFPLSSGTRQRRLLAQFFNIVLEVLANSVKKKKRYKNWKRSKTAFTDDMIVYLANPEIFRLLE